MFQSYAELSWRKIETPTLEKFMKHWVKLFQNSYKARLIWRQKPGQSPKPNQVVEQVGV